MKVASVGLEAAFGDPCGLLSVAVTCRAVYDRLHYEGFIAGIGANGYRANVRSAIKRIRNKFRDFDPTFDRIENYTAFGYRWRKPA